MRFREALIQTVEQAVSDGEITQREAFRIRALSLLPRVRRVLEESVAEQAMSQGMLPAGSSMNNLGAFDWSSILAFIKQILPLIMEIIDALS